LPHLQHSITRSPTHCKRLPANTRKSALHDSCTAMRSAARPRSHAPSSLAATLPSSKRPSAPPSLSRFVPLHASPDAQNDECSRSRSTRCPCAPTLQEAIGKATSMEEVQRLEALLASTATTAEALKAISKPLATSTSTSSSSSSSSANGAMHVE